jgi:hypothetical protein
MVVVRWTYNTKRGYAEKAASIIKQARQTGSFVPASARIYVSVFGTRDQVALEMEFQSYAEMETVFKRVTANPPAWFTEIDPLLMNNDVSQTWELIQ